MKRADNQSKFPNANFRLPNETIDLPLKNKAIIFTMMNLGNQLEICKKCAKSKVDWNTGTICGLTNQKPNFESNCPDYEAGSSSAEPYFNVDDEWRTGRKLPGRLRLVKNPSAVRVLIQLARPARFPKENSIALEKVIVKQDKPLGPLFVGIGLFVLVAFFIPNIWISLLVVFSACVYGFVFVRSYDRRKEDGVVAVYAEKIVLNQLEIQAENIEKYFFITGWILGRMGTYFVIETKDKAKFYYDWDGMGMPSRKFHGHCNAILGRQR